MAFTKKLHKLTITFFLKGQILKNNHFLIILSPMAEAAAAKFSIPASSH